MNKLTRFERIPATISTIRIVENSGEETKEIGRGAGNRTARVTKYFPTALPRFEPNSRLIIAGPSPDYFAIKTITESWLHTAYARLAR